MVSDTAGVPLLRVSGVGHGYGDREVLGPVSLEVRPGECVALVGPNGCGKSTLLRLAVGVEAPVRGEVLFDGAPVDADSPGTRARISSVLHAAAHYPDLTVREHLVFTALAHGLGDAADAAVDRALEEHHLAGRAHALPSSLSSGQAQQMLLAAAFLRPHDLLVLDEPEQRLDSRARAELAERLLAHKASGRASLIATHDHGMASLVADRTVALEPAGAADTEPAGASRDR
ncbi:ATP-binding cassette domain-containing protein [Streptomyces desertarenae]|uniref:ATP-binding cassette domain-containing protein n=1 Tax=Streptomyces desertarenae TaxID=2666184 RepID=A0ABW4PDP2_9ACTN